MVHGNPFFQIEAAAEEALRGVEQAVRDGHAVLANRNAGWHTLTASMEVLSTRVGSLEREAPAISLPTGAKWIALENDTELSEGTREYLTGQDPRHALVPEIRRRAEGELQGAIKAFVEGGGHTAFAETTGLDHDQLRNLALWLIKSGVKNLTVRLTGGMTPEVGALRTEAERAGATVTVLESY